MKKIFLIIFLGAFLLPSISLAYNVYQTPSGVNVIYKGIVPCGKPVNLGGTLTDGILSGGNCCEMPCTFCHFFVMAKGIIDFVLFKIIPPIAILMLVIGGAMFMVASFSEWGGPVTLSQAKKLITSVVIGLIIIFASWLIINLFFQVFGVGEWTGLQTGWFSVPCSTEVEKCEGRLTEENCAAVRAAGRIPCATVHHDKTPVQASECLE
jgi:hypothetical protein